MTLRSQCAWCSRVLVEGDPGAPVSHGICEPCAALESRKLVVSPLVALDSRRVENGGASLRVSSAAAVDPLAPSAALPALERARQAYLAHERRIPVQLELA